jgi:hypothetical protein
VRDLLVQPDRLPANIGYLVLTARHDDERHAQFPIPVPHVLGLASIAHDVTPELARATIESVVVLGALRASPAVKAALADRIR